MSITTLALTDKVSVAFGLSWRTVDVYESRHAQVTQWRTEGYSAYATSRAGGAEQMGLLSQGDGSELEGNKGRQLFSAAALLASHPDLKGRTVLVLLQGVDDAYAVGLQGGGVTIDEVVAYPEVTSLRARFAKECQQRDQDYGVVGVIEGKAASPELGQLDGTLAWSELVRKSMPATARIRPLSSGRTLKVGLSIAALLIALGAMAQGYRWHQAREDHKRQLALERARDPALLYAQAVQGFTSRADVIVPVASGVRSLRAVLGGLPTQRATWQLRRVDCNVATGSCTTEWTSDKTRLGTFADFKAAMPPLPADWTIQLGPQLDKLTVTIPANASRAPIPDAAARPTMQEFLAGDGSRLQKLASLGFVLSLKEPQLVDVGIATPRAIAESSPFALRAAGWAVSGQPWWLAEGLEGLSGNVTLDSLSATFTGRDVRFSAEGKIYVRN